MKFIPILFSTPMVQAILTERKFQTRRIVKPQPTGGGWRQCKRCKKDIAICKCKFLSDAEALKATRTISGEMPTIDQCPYGKPGDVLWVRETSTFAIITDSDDELTDHNSRYFYAADDDWTKVEWEHPTKEDLQSSPVWKPSIHMPKKACRIWLEIISIRIERVHEISDNDAIAEGIKPIKGTDLFHNYMKQSNPCSPKLSFQTLWESINGIDSYRENPYVWVIDFRRVEKPDNFLKKD